MRDNAPAEALPGARRLRRADDCHRLAARGIAIPKLVRQFSKFAIVGVLNTVVDFLVLNALLWATGIREGLGLLALNTVAFTAALLNSYGLNKRWTFRDRGRDREAAKFSQFVVVSLCAAVLNGATVSGISSWIAPPFGLDPLLWVNVAKAVATALTLLWNFVGYKFIVFRR
jgi:putative flippase GtrA